MLPTTRLNLRHLDWTDVDRLVELDADPEVMWFLTKGVATPRVVIEEQLSRQLDAYAEHPAFGRFAAELVATGQFVGWAGLEVSTGGTREPVLGYRLLRRHWAQGLATEAAEALVAHGFRQPEVERITAETMAVNDRSRAVLEHAGLRHVHTYFPHFEDPIPGSDQGEVVYAITRQEYSAGPARAAERPGDSHRP